MTGQVCQLYSDRRQEKAIGLIINHRSIIVLIYPYGILVISEGHTLTYLMYSLFSELNYVKYYSDFTQQLCLF